MFTSKHKVTLTHDILHGSPDWGTLNGHCTSNAILDQLVLRTVAHTAVRWVV
jgi:hypothetical protein